MVICVSRAVLSWFDLSWKQWPSPWRTKLNHNRVSHYSRKSICFRMSRKHLPRWILMSQYVCPTMEMHQRSDVVPREWPLLINSNNLTFHSGLGLGGWGTAQPSGWRTTWRGSYSRGRVSTVVSSTGSVKDALPTEWCMTSTVLRMHLTCSKRWLPRRGFSCLWALSPHLTTCHFCWECG